MHQAEFDVPYIEARNRGTTAIRIILVIPHLILAYVWNIASEVATFIHWFICVFTGKRNKALWDFTNNYVAYATARLLVSRSHARRVSPVRNRSGVGARPLQPRVRRAGEPAHRRPSHHLGHPALIISMLLAIAVCVLVIISWFVIVITGKHPKGMFDFLLKAMKYLVQTSAYFSLLTDKYPQY